MSAVLTPTLTASPWRSALFALGFVLLCLAVVYRDTMIGMVGIWHRSETFAHAFLVPPITLWLIWRQRAVLARLVPRPQPWLLAGMAVCSVVWLLADLVLVNAASQFAWVGMLVLAVPAVLGLQVASVILFPLLFLFFGVPFGEFMLQPMMNWTADFVVIALQITGVPIYREGLRFVIPTGSWSVIDECSGVRYLIASFMVGSLFAYLNYRSYKKRAVFMLVSLAVPIVANWLRAYIIVMLGHLSGNRIAVGIDHILYGWVFFGVVIFVMFMIGARWAEPDDPQPQGPAPSPAAGTFVSRSGLLMATVSGALLISVAPHLAVWELQRGERAASTPQLILPPTLSAGWELTEKPALEWAPRWQNPSVLAHHGYAGPAGRVGLFVAYYRSQDADRKLVSSLNEVVGLNERTWNPLGTARVSVESAGRRIGGQSTNIQPPPSADRASPKALVAWRVYWIDGRFVASNVEAKLRNALARLLGRGDDGAVVVIYADRGSFEDAAAAVQAFAAANLTPLGDVLQQTRDLR